LANKANRKRRPDSGNKRAKDNKSLALSNNNNDYPDNTKNHIADPQEAGIVSAEWSAPLPPPGAMRAYQEIIPDMPERLLASYEKQVNHRLKIEEATVQALIKNMERGQIIGGAIAVLFLIGALYCAYIGASAAACVIGGTTVVGLVSVFIYAQNATSKNDEEQE
jgi:uncharacterized membrane protein